MVWTVKKGVSTHAVFDENRTKAALIRVKRGVYTIENSAGLNILCIREDGPSRLSITGSAGVGRAVYPIAGYMSLVWNNIEIVMRQLSPDICQIYREDGLIGSITAMTKKLLRIEMPVHPTPEFAALLFVLSLAF